MPSTSLLRNKGSLTRVTSTYAMLSMNATSIAPPTDKPMGSLCGRPLANVVFSPVCGSTREVLPATPSVTYSAPSGPTVLPLALSKPVSRPVTSSVAVGPGHARRPLAADGVIIATKAAANKSTIPISTDFVTRIAGFRASARMVCFFMIQFPFFVEAGWLFVWLQLEMYSRKFGLRLHGKCKKLLRPQIALMKRMSRCFPRTGRSTGGQLRKIFRDMVKDERHAIARRKFEQPFLAFRFAEFVRRLDDLI